MAETTASYAPHSAAYLSGGVELIEAANELSVRKTPGATHSCQRCVNHLLKRGERCARLRPKQREFCLRVSFASALPSFTHCALCSARTQRSRTVESLHRSAGGASTTRPAADVGGRFLEHGGANTPRWSGTAAKARCARLSGHVAQVRQRRGSGAARGAATSAAGSGGARCRRQKPDFLAAARVSVVCVLCFAAQQPAWRKPHVLPFMSTGFNVRQVTRRAQQSRLRIVSQARRAYRSSAAAAASRALLRRAAAALPRQQQGPRRATAWRVCS